MSDGLRIASGELQVQTSGRGLWEVSGDIQNWLDKEDVREGVLTVFIQHTSASLTIQENADPDVLRDLNDYFNRTVPDGDPNYWHRSEGPDDMPAHIRGSLTDVSLSIPVHSGRMTLGTWQGVFVFEHRARPHHRRIALNFIGR